MTVTDADIAELATLLKNHADSLTQRIRGVLHVRARSGYRQWPRVPVFGRRRVHASVCVQTRATASAFTETEMSRHVWCGRSQSPRRAKNWSTIPLNKTNSLTRHGIADLTNTRSGD
jgi:hypothetical protein